MTLSILGWVDGITGSLVVIIGIVFGIYFLSQGLKKKAKMLTQLAFVTIFAGLMYLGVLLDFLSILTTNNNFPNEMGQVPVLSYIWFPPMVAFAIHLAISVQYPKKVWWATGPALIAGVIFLFRMFQDPLGSFYIGFYESNLPHLIDYNINMTSPAGIWMISMFAVVILLFVIGLFYNSTKTTGTLKGKFIFLAVGAICYGVAGLMEGFVVLEATIIIVRVLYSSSFVIMYFGLKTIQA